MVFELVKLVTPLQAGIAVVICMALSARHMDQYNKHMEKYGPLGGLLIEKRAHNNKRPAEAEEVAQGVDDAALRKSSDRLV